MEFGELSILCFQRNNKCSMLKTKFYMLASLLILIGCDQIVEDFNTIHNKNHIVTCKHPLGHIIKYEITSYEARYPYSLRAGVWSFETIKGLKVISTYCHLEISKGELI